MRCIARFIHENHLQSGTHYTIETKAGIVKARVHDYDHIEISMGIPEFAPARIPLEATEQQSQYEMTLPHETARMHFYALSMGNPHAVITVPSIKNYPIATVGPAIATHAMFPQGTNVGFMEIANRGHIRLRTYERGAGETLACGSNSCAAAVAGIAAGLLDNKVTVELALGKLQIEWQGNKEPVLMTGPATLVYHGTIF
jgi:diaminopimelate epimerase